MLSAPNLDRAVPPPEAGASPTDGRSFGFDAIGTRWSVESSEVIDEPARRRVLDAVEYFDRRWSRFRGDSEVARLAKAQGGATFDIPAEDAPLFDLYDRLFAATDGAIDPLVGGDLERLGYDPAYSLRRAAGSGSAGDRPSWSRDVIRDGARARTTRSVVIDLGAAGKGFLVDRVLDILRDEGHTDLVVDGSGDLRHAGAQALRVGLEHPFAPGLAVGVANLCDAALCASAANRRAWGDGLHHVIDARTGRPTAAVVATWVIAGTAALADGLATALFFAPGERLAASFEFAFVRMFADGRAEISRNFPGEIFHEV